MDQKQWRRFVRKGRTCWVAHIGDDGVPWPTPGYCRVIRDAMGRDVLEISTMAARGKARSVERGRPVSVSVWDEKWPPAYVAVTGPAEIDRDPDRAAAMFVCTTGLMAAGKRRWWRPHPAPAKVPARRRAQLTELTAKEQRVVFRLIIEEQFHTSPRHTRRWRSFWDWLKHFGRKSKAMADVDTLSHSIGKRMPW